MNALKTIFWVGFGLLFTGALVHCITKVPLANWPVVAIVCVVGVLVAVRLPRRSAAASFYREPFRCRYIGGIEVHYYRDGSRIVWNDGQLVEFEVGDATGDEDLVANPSNSDVD